MSESQDAEVKALRIRLRVVTAQRDVLLSRARQVVFQGLSEDRPYRLLAGEPLRAQLILMSGAVRDIEEWLS